MLSCLTFGTSVAQVTSLSSRTLAGKLGLILHVPSQHRSVSQEANWVYSSVVLWYAHAIIPTKQIAA